VDFFSLVASAADAFAPPAAIPAANAIAPTAARIRRDEPPLPLARANSDATTNVPKDLFQTLL
jgi:hypothetical protein